MDTKRLLVVDDDRPITELVRIVFEPAGYTVAVANDGKAALETLKKFRPHVVVLDIMMPEIHGYDICRHIKSDEALKDIKVVMLTAKSLPVDRAKAEAAGADAYLVKPVDLSELYETVNRLLNKGLPGASSGPAA